MHQTAQRNKLASTTPGRVDHRGDSFKFEANNRGAIAAVAVQVEAVRAERVPSDSSKNSPARRISTKPYPYQPGHQVALLHLQAEADALILKLQAASQKQMASS